MLMFSAGNVSGVSWLTKVRFRDIVKTHHTQLKATTNYIVKMVLAKSKNAVGLGNSLMNDRFGKGKGADMRKGNFQGGIERTGQAGERVCS